MRAGGARIYRAADPASRVIERQRTRHDLAFLVDDALLARGWLRRPGGGYLQASRVRLFTPSSFVGAHEPSLPLAFALRDTPALRRHDRLPVVRLDGRTVQLPTGAVRRSLVAVAAARRRPGAIPAGVRWVHVDLSEQTLVAYDGDHPVLATLVSTGREKFETPPGLYRVYYKEVHASMHGEEPEHYFVDEVPFVQYFRGDMALHGTFWHDRFGVQASHGCVNLSLADAEFLFGWAPPSLPTGWHGIDPDAAKLPSLWVLVERHAPPPPHNLSSARASRSRASDATSRSAGSLAAGVSSGSIAATWVAPSSSSNTATLQGMSTPASGRAASARWASCGLHAPSTR